MKLKQIRLNSPLILIFIIFALTASSVQAKTDALPSWNDGQAKAGIMRFVEQVTKTGSPNYVPPAERVAVFDNDGTLWAEQPMYFQFFFAIDRVKALAPKHPEWQKKEPFASLIKGDVKKALAGGEHAILEIIMATHSGMTNEALPVKKWLPTKNR